MITMKLRNHIFSIAHKENFQLTNIHFNRILFFAFGLTLAEYPKDSKEYKLIKKGYKPGHKFERWRYGAIVPIIYEINVMNIYHGIINFNKKESIVCTSKLDEGRYYDELSIFDNNISKLFQADPTRLIQLNLQLSHHLEYIGDILEGRHIPVIEFNEIENDFRNLE